MFIRKRFFRRSIASFFLIQILVDLGWPSLSFALTAGPTAPEASSFEPVDTTDMVDLATGDFTYNIPLLEVPGPDGGYPLSLAYHAGIQPEVEASWVGLGWSLNPGAINRNVNGYADDHNNAQQTIRDYWEGGKKTTYSVGMKAEFGNVASVSAGISFSDDTYRGFGVGGYRYIRAGIAGTPLGVSKVDFNDGYGKNYGQTGADISTSNMRVGITRSDAGSVGSSLGLKVAGNLQASLNTRTGSFSLNNATGAGSISNDRAGRIQTQTINNNLDIPITPGLAVELGYSSIRYWSDETSSASTNGALYFPKDHLPNSFISRYDYNGEYREKRTLDDKAFDTYRLLEPQGLPLLKHYDPDYLQGGSFPEYDNYTVLAQGLSGTMRPYSLQQSLYSRNRRADNEDYTIKSDPLPWTNSEVGFRFDNDFSNQFRQENGAMNTSSYNGSYYPFDNNPIYGNQDGNFGYNPSTKKLAGSKHINWYTNENIKIGNCAGFINTKSLGFNRTVLNDKSIGGFSITNASGVTYHYALPVHSYGEQVFTENIDKEQGNTFSRLQKPAHYAYTWLLTAITGPDYVDRGESGYLDTEDWGYWVKFDYGRWTGKYAWQNAPIADINSNNITTARGYKELYYLNTVSTRTHTAIFEKAGRRDGWGPNLASDINWIPPRGGDIILGPYSGSVMSLKNIYIIKNENVPANLQNKGRSIEFGHNGEIDNVIDSSDILSLGFDIKEVIEKAISLNQDYSLCQNVQNSIPVNPNSSKKLGKLTLKSILHLGKGGIASMPSTKFNYELNIENIKKSTAAVELIDQYRGVVSMINSTGVQPNKGDIIKLNNLNIYATVIENNSTKYQIKLLENSNISLLSQGQSHEITTTKNPPYTKNMRDVWGMFKSDLDSKLSTVSTGDVKRTSSLSNASTDVWSLRSIVTPIGTRINIEYEGDEYGNSVLKKPRIICHVFGNNASHSLRMPTPYTAQQQQQLFKAGEDIYFTGIIANPTSANSCYFNNWNYEFVKNIKLTIKSINQDKILEVENSNIIDKPLSQCQITIHSFIADGYVFKQNDVGVQPGGGIRVKSISASANGYTHKTTYSYNVNPFNNLTSSGVTSYEPVSNPSVTTKNSKDLSVPENIINMLDAEYSSQFSHLLSVAREIPSPGVMYSSVSVGETKFDSNNTTTQVPVLSNYQFEVFNSNMVGIQYGGINELHPTLFTRNISINDFTNRIGALKHVTTYNNNGIKLSQTTNNYLHDNLINKTHEENVSEYTSKLAQYNYQGVIQESFGDNRSVLREIPYGSGYQTVRYDQKVVMSKRNSYPVIQTGTTTTDFITGITTTAQTLGYDFYSGEPIKTLQMDGYGNRFVTETVPAYRRYPAMGLKLNQPNNRHMLSQTASTTIYKVNASNTPLAVVGASVNTWSDAVPVIGTTPSQPENRSSQSAASGLGGAIGVWRPWQTFSWMPNGATSDGLTSLSGTNGFVDYFTQPTHAAWRQVNEITLYNVFSNPLEARDMRNIFAATKLGFNQSKVLISGGPARYGEIVYTGAEDDMISNRFGGPIQPHYPSGTSDASSVVKKSDGYPVHTGERSLLLNPSRNGFAYEADLTGATYGKANFDLTKPYRVTMWATHPQASLYYCLDNQTCVTVPGVATRKAGDWYLITMDIPVLGAGHNYLRIGSWNAHSAPVYLDDFRIQPANATAAAYVYDQLTGQVTHVLDNNNLYTHYDYDAAGKLRRVTRETLQQGPQKVAEYDYRVVSSLDDAILEQPTSCTLHVNVPLSAGAVDISYDLGDGHGYRVLTTAVRPYRVTLCSGAGTAPSAWVKVKVRDGHNNMRELVKRVR
ncbi:hypothetical protein [Hymenobacter sublimis]|uniref:Uncharacterized protein n=1 Tax=Hymenobacter sublimis TaxID=2933777 RepID=A0ABY4JEM5_9BACT|nr:hypothetical protein [Hymenobacter sublimis]UPL50201.1 hypothetical protein MWH26_04655 [Hymenobacter sublimis]